MFARTQDQLTREAAAPKGSSFIAWCMQVSGAGGLAYGQASTIGSSKRFAHQGLSFGLGATKPVSLVENLVNRLGYPEDRP